MLTDIQQLRQLLEDKKYVLITFRRDADGDAIGGALSLKAFLEKQHKQADIASAGFVAPKNLKFLPQIDQIKGELANLQKFIIKVDVSKAKIDTLSYDVKDNWLSIYLTPKQGALTKNELRTAQSTFKYDLIITVDTEDLESLGEIFYNNTDLFYRLPLVNLDHHAGNEHFGQVNLVDVTASSTAEVIFKTMKQLGEAFIDANIATALLTGMVVKTKSFKTADVNPRTLNLASELISCGGEREKIVQHLYRTKTIATLKLWGQALTHLQSDSQSGLVWTTLTREDFARTGGSEDDLRGIIDDLISNSPEAKLILLIYEDAGGQGVRSVIFADKNHDAVGLAREWGGTGNKKQAVIGLPDKTLKEAETEILEALREKIKQ